MKKTNKKESINLKKTDKLFLIIGFISIIMGTGIGAYMITCLHNKGITYSNVNSSKKASAPSCTYGHASSYTTLKNNYFQNSATSFFDGDILRIAYRSSNTTSNKGLAIYPKSTKTARSFLYYQPSDDTTRLAALNSSGSYGGTLDLRGNPVQINGTAFQSMLLLKEYTIDNVSISAGGTVSKTQSVALSGYTPLTSNCFVNSASSGGSNTQIVNVWWCDTNGSNVTMQASTLSNSAAKVSYVIEVLYVKNT